MLNHLDPPKLITVRTTPRTLSTQKSDKLPGVNLDNLIKITCSEDLELPKQIKIVSIPRTLNTQKSNSQPGINPKNLSYITCSVDVKPTTKFIKCGLLNIRALSSKCLLINELISDLKIEFMALTETWLKPDEFVKLNECTPPTHINFQSSRTEGGGGGVAAISHSSLTLRPKSTQKFNSFETLTLSLSFPNQRNTKAVSLIIVYRPPAKAYSEFLTDFSEFLPRTVLDCDKIMIVGDFNVHVDNDNDSLNKAFTALLEDVGFTQNVPKNTPTHKFGHTLDLILTYGIDICDLNIISQNPIITDHSLLTFQFQIEDYVHPKEKIQLKRTITDKTVINYKEIIQPLLPVLPCNLRENGPLSDPIYDQFVDNTMKALKTALDSVAPLKPKVIRPGRRAPWFTSETLDLKQNTRRLEKCWRKLKTEKSLNDWKSSLLSYKEALYKAKQAYYSSLIEVNKDNPRFLFSTIARLTSSHSEIEPSVPAHLSSNDFLQFFNSKIVTIREKINERSPNISLEPPLDAGPVLPFLPLVEFSTIDVAELTSIISSSKSSSCLLDPIPTKLLKEILPTIIHTILNIINASLENGHVPNSFKCAVIKPLLKKPNLDPDSLVNYRPISNLPFISKVLEKVVVKQLCCHLQNNSLFEKFQSGFRSQHSTETALVKVTNDLLLAADAGLVSILVLLDLSAAFDTIDHNILLHRLEREVGIGGTALRWFKSYLSDRHQFVNVNDVSSTSSEVNYGVPQGSVLGPILFMLYMLPLGNIIRNHDINFHCYADDTQLYLSIKPDQTDRIHRLSACVKDITSWMTANLLLLNSDKTEVMILGPQNQRDALSEQIVTLDNINISSSSTVRNLGVIFDQDLSFKAHIKQACKTAYFHLRNIAKIRHLLSISDAEKLIHAFVSSRIDYCNSLLAGCPKTTIKGLQLVQNAAARLLTRTNRREHITPVLKSLHWLPVEFRIKFKILLLTYKATNGLAPIYLQDAIVPYQPNRALRSQNAKRLVPFAASKKTVGERSFSFQAPKLWNDLPIDIKNSDSVSTFKTRLKTFLFDKAFNNLI